MAWFRLFGSKIDARQTATLTPAGSLPQVAKVLRVMTSKGASQERIKALMTRKQAAGAKQPPPQPPGPRGPYRFRTSLPCRSTKEVIDLVKQFVAANPKTNVVAPPLLIEGGKVVRMSGNDPATQQPLGVVRVESVAGERGNDAPVYGIEATADPGVGGVKLVVRYPVVGSEVQAPSAKNAGDLSYRLKLAGMNLKGARK